MKSILDISGRILYGLPMAVFGIFHFLNGKNLVGIVPTYFPFPIFWVYLTGLGMILACIFIIGKIKYANIAALLLAFILLCFILLIHVPGLMVEANRQMHMMSILSDTTMMGAAISYAAQFSTKNS